MELTDEQLRAIELFKTGESLAIEAGAGTGKTSTLIELARAAGRGRNGQYVAFNKALVVEASEKFPMNVETNTAHSLAFRAYGRQFQHRLNSSARMPGWQLAQRLGVSSMEVMTFDGKPKTLSAGYMASLVNRTVTKFCQSADESIEVRHTPFVEGLDDESTMRVRWSLVAPAHVLWADLQKLEGWAPYKHEHYLKGWQLRDPRIKADFVLFDESQDANPVIAAIIAAQAGHAQLVYVGDSQQEIYSWTGAINALAKVQVANRTYLTQSFRFGQVIADRANQVLNALDAPLRLTGNPAIESRLERLDSPKTILVRTNATGLGLLLGFQREGVKAHFIGGTAELVAFARGAAELMETGRTIHPDLVLFDSWNAVCEYVKDEDGSDLRLNVKLVNDFGTEKIIGAIDQMPQEGRAEIVISTAHRSKGREWKSVKLANDFPQAADSDPADLRLLYVAITRAKEALDVTALDEGGGELSGLFVPEANEVVH